MIANHPHDIGLKCSPGENLILAKNCLDHVICPYIRKLVKYRQGQGFAICNAFVRDWVRIGIRLEG